MIALWLKRLGAFSLALVLCVPSGCAVLAGGARLIMWSDAKQPGQYAVDYPYLSDAIPWIAMGLLGMMGSFAVLTSSRRTLKWLCLPVITLLYCALLPLQKEHGFFFHRATHPMAGVPIHWAHAMTRLDLNRIAEGVAQQGKTQGKFDCPPATGSDRSRFTQGGESLLYKVECAQRPSRYTPLAPLRPATIVMTVSEDGKEAWFRVSSLVSDIGGVTEWTKSNGGYHDYLVHHSVRTEIE